MQIFSMKRTKKQRERLNMSSNRLKVVAICGVIILLLSGCGRNTVQTYDSSKVVKPDKITVMWDDSIFVEGQNYAQEFYTAISNELDIAIDWVRPSSYARYLEDALKGGHSLADVMVVPANLLAKYSAKGKFWNMTAAWNASETANSGRLIMGADSVLESWYVSGPEGEKRIYGFYPARSNECVTYVRAEWARNAGYVSEEDLPSNWEEYKVFLQRMKENNGGQAPVLPISGFYQTKVPYTQYLQEFWQDAYLDFYYNYETGKWTDGFTEDSMVAALDRISWGVANGYINKAVFDATSSSTVLNDYFYTGKIGIVTAGAGTQANTNISGLNKNGQDTECWVLKPLDEMGGYMEARTPMICISSKCKNPEGVFKYFIDTMLDGDRVQMLWQYGVEGVHYEWNEDHTKLTGLVTESTKGTDSEKKTTMNLIDPSKKLATLSFADPYQPKEVVQRSLELFWTNSKPAPLTSTSELASEYGSYLWNAKKELILKVAKGELTGAEAVQWYIDEYGRDSKAVCNSFR